MSKTGADQGTKQALLYSIFRSIRQIFPVMISIFFCMGVFVFSNVSVSAKEQETVKVGYYFSHNFQEIFRHTVPLSVVEQSSYFLPGFNIPALPRA